MANERCSQCGTTHGLDESCPAQLGNGNLIRWRLGQLEEINAAERLTSLEAGAKTIEGLSKSMEGIRSWMWKLIGGLVLALILMIANLVMAAFSNQQAAQRDIRETHKAHGVVDAP